jgi:Domain of unknown function (DUF305)
MKGWLQRWQQPMPATGGMAHEAEPAPGMMSQGQLDWLATLDGRAFDLGFTTSMKPHHLGAIKMANSVLQEGRSSEVRMLANQILTLSNTRSTSWPNGMTLCRKQVNQGSRVATAPYAHATAADAPARCPSLGAYTLQGYSRRAEDLGGVDAGIRQ